MAYRRGLSSLGEVITSLGRLSMTCRGSAPTPTAQQLATLTSLRQLALAHESGVAPLQPAGLLRPFSSAAAAAAADGAAAGPGPSESLEEVRARIFGTHIGNGLRSGRKVLRQKLLGPTLVAYYPEDISKKDPFMLDLQAERAKLKVDRLKRRGKAPPKKGSGKRAGKKR